LVLASKAATAQTLGGACQLSSTGLGSSPSAGAAAATTPRLAGETTAATALGAGPGRFEPTTATAGGTAPRSVVVGAAVGVSLGAALLNDDVLAVHSVGIGGDGGVVTGLGLELDESAVLGSKSASQSLMVRMGSELVPFGG
jgi:hypothetical protein